MCPQASTTPRYKNRLTSLNTTKKIYIIHRSWCLYRTTTCSSLRRRWWPTTTCPRKWWQTTHRTLLPKQQASTHHRRKHSCSPHYGPPWWRHPHTLLQEALILDTCPHALRHILQHHLQMMTYVIEFHSDRLQRRV
jgi:hypothetical protein